MLNIESIYNKVCNYYITNNLLNEDETDNPDEKESAAIEFEKTITKNINAYFKITDSFKNCIATHQGGNKNSVSDIKITSTDSAFNEFYIECKYYKQSKKANSDKDNSKDNSDSAVIAEPGIKFIGDVFNPTKRKNAKIVEDNAFDDHIPKIRENYSIYIKKFNSSYVPFSADKIIENNKFTKSCDEYIKKISTYINDNIFKKFNEVFKNNSSLEKEINNFNITQYEDTYNACNALLNIIKKNISFPEFPEYNKTTITKKETKIEKKYNNYIYLYVINIYIKAIKQAIKNSKGQNLYDVLKEFTFTPNFICLGINFTEYSTIKNANNQLIIKNENELKIAEQYKKFINLHRFMLVPGFIIEKSNIYPEFDSYSEDIKINEIIYGSYNERNVKYIEFLDILISLDEKDDPLKLNNKIYSLSDDATKNQLQRLLAIPRLKIRSGNDLRMSLRFEFKNPKSISPQLSKKFNFYNNFKDDAKNIKENTKKKNVQNKTIALVGGSFKPPHAGHFYMVEQYAKKADKVIVVISDPKKSIRTTKNGAVITPKMSKAIWDIYVDRYGLGNKVEVKISSQASPIAAIYDYIDNTLKDCNIILGASKKDNDFKRFTKAESYFVKEGRDDINILDPETAAVDPYANNGKPISAGQIRDNIDDPEIIKTMLPKKLNSDDIDSIISILSDEI